MHRLVVALVWMCSPSIALAGTTEHSLTIDGHKRTYRVFTPDHIDEPLPVVLAIHGGGGSGQQMQRYTRFDTLAEKEGFIVVYPDALEGNWNDGRGISFMRAQKENIDDVGFVRRIIDELDKTTKIDRGRIFATGVSNGGFITNRLAAEASDLICAAAPVVGGMAPAIFEKFQPAFPVSVLVIQGDADPIVPIHGGDVRVGVGRARGKLVDTDKMVAKYVERNGNHGEPAVTTIDADAKDGTTIEARTYPDGPGGVKTAYWIIKGGGHSWPGRGQYAAKGMIGKVSRDIDATSAIWDFFKSCPGRGKPQP